MKTIVTTKISLFAAIIVIALLAGCGGGGSGGGGTIPIDPPDTGVNQAPAITSFSPQGTASSPVRIPVNGKQKLTVSASDPDNDTLTYTWSVNQGKLVGTGQEVEFTAPATPCNATVEVKVSDGHNHTATAQCCFVVFKADEPDPPDPGKNDPPVINSLVANPASVDVNGTSTITVNATDPDGDPLSYSWTANGGSIQSESGNTAGWKAPAYKGSCTITVAVSDGKNPAVTKGISIAVAGSAEPPMVAGLSAAYIQNDHVFAHPDLSKGKVVFTRIDPAINFDWGRKAPDPRLITLPDIQNGHDYGVVWKGYIKCEAQGIYKFRANYDDGFKLWISDDANKMQQVLDGWFTGPMALDGVITLEGGKWYKLEAQYFADEDRSYVQLFWQPPGAANWAIVPTNVLRTDK